MSEKKDGQLSDAEVRKLLEEAAKINVRRSLTDEVDLEKVATIHNNKKKKGRVWIKDKKKKGE